MEYLREKSAKGLEQLSHDTAQDNNTHSGFLYQQYLTWLAIIAWVLLISAEEHSLELALLWRSGASSICQFYIDIAHLLQPTAAMFMVASIWCMRMAKTLFTIISWPIHTFSAYVPYVTWVAFSNDLSSKTILSWTFKICSCNMN